MSLRAYFFSGKPRLDRFLAAVYLLGLATGSMAMFADGLHLTIPLLLFAIYGAAAAPFLVDLGGNCRLSTAFSFILASAILLGPAAAVITALASTASYAMSVRQQMLPHKRLFNVCNHVLAGFVAAHIFVGLGGSPGAITAEPSLRAMLAATCGFFLVNTGLVGVASALEHNRPVLETWVEKYQWAASSFLAGGTLAVLLVLLVDRAGVLTCFLAFPFCVVIHHSWTLHARLTKTFKASRRSAADEPRGAEAHPISILGSKR